MLSRWWSSAGNSITSDMPRQEQNTIPPELLEEQMKAAIQDAHQVFRATGKIIINSENQKLTPKEILLLLNDWSLHYSGPFLLEGPLKGAVLLAASDLHYTPWGEGGRYGRLMGYECSFAFRSSDHIPRKFLSYKYEGRRKAGSLSCYLMIDLEFSPTSGAARDYSVFLDDCRKVKFYPDDPAHILATWYPKIIIEPQSKSVCF
ncbi:matrix [Tupavirus incomtus]|uniref:Matrix n=1 Tax=Tupavirus sp. TaxID=2809944 RepID=A0AAE9ZXQ9_9RHAB|nr:matrix [Tupavirus sp.]